MRIHNLFREICFCRIVAGIRCFFRRPMRSNLWRRCNPWWTILSLAESLLVIYFHHVLTANDGQPVVRRSCDPDFLREDVSGARKNQVY